MGRKQSVANVDFLETNLCACQRAVVDFMFAAIAASRFHNLKTALCQAAVIHDKPQMT
jgi:hypothetical protein